MANQTIHECNACGGLYTPIQNDGTEYYHVCPSRRLVRNDPAPTKADPDATVAVFEPIPNRRDERVKGLDKTGQPIIMAAGAGASIVTDAARAAVFTANEESV